MNSFDEFVTLWVGETHNKKIYKRFKDMLFLVVYPDKLKWDFGIEKQTQTTTFMISGGATGSGTGHDVHFCYRSEVHDVLLNCDHTNFTNGERSRKSFSYYRDHQTESWKDLDNVDIEDYYFSRFMTRIRKQFYIENTERVGELPTEKFDIIFSTTAGQRAALIVDRLEFDGEVVLFDYCQENLDIKQMIVEMNMSLKEIGYYSKRLTHNMVMPDSISSKNAKRDMPAFEDLRKLEQKMHNDYDIEYWLMDLISPNYDRLLKKIKGKTIFFDATNIFCYHMSHAYYTLDELVNAYNNLLDVLKHADETYLRGWTPTKQRYDKWIS